MPTFQTFKDLNITFKKHPNTDDLVVVKDDAAIKQAIKNLLLTNVGERPFQPALGSKIPRLLFEPLDFISSSMIKDEIRRVIGEYEPRVELVNVECEPNSNEDGYDVEFDVRIMGRDDAIALELFLERTR
jgi:uncharacterized protein